MNNTYIYRYAAHANIAAAYIPEFRDQTGWRMTQEGWQSVSWVCPMMRRALPALAWLATAGQWSAGRTTAKILRTQDGLRSCSRSRNYSHVESLACLSVNLHAHPGIAQLQRGFQSLRVFTTGWKFLAPGPAELDFILYTTYAKPENVYKHEPAIANTATCIQLGSRDCASTQGC